MKIVGTINRVQCTFQKYWLLLEPSYMHGSISLFFFLHLLYFGLGLQTQPQCVVYSTLFEWRNAWWAWAPEGVSLVGMWGLGPALLVWEEHSPLQRGWCPGSPVPLCGAVGWLHNRKYVATIYSVCSPVGLDDVGA